jgi:adenylate kinase
MAPNLIMLGPPGAGKGTQAERFARARGIPRVSTGDILREAVHAGTDTGLRVKVVMDRGELVGDDGMIGIVRERRDQPDARKGFVLEGFPRTVAQATWRSTSSWRADRRSSSWTSSCRSPKLVRRLSHS